MSNSPGSDFYVVGGGLRADAPSYVERRADADLYKSLTRGELCYALTPRQMGKSSLIARTAARLRAGGRRAVVLDLTAIGRSVTVDQWYYGLLDCVAEQTGLDDVIEAVRRDEAGLGPLGRFMAAVRRAAQHCADRPMVVLIDEVDVVRSLPFSTDEFFAAIRAAHNRVGDDTSGGSATFCLMGAAAPTDIVRDPRVTPFNVGRRIELLDFTAAEAAPLARGLAADPGRRTALLRRILYWTGGHPYLTQCLCRTVAAAHQAGSFVNVDRICRGLFLSRDAQERDTNLVFVREHLLRTDTDVAALLDLYGRVRAGRRVPDNIADPLASALRMAGIVTASDGVLRVRNRIYAHVFDGHWVRQQMPDAEVRRQRAAYRKGALRAALAACAILLVMAGLVAANVRATRDAVRSRRLAERSAVRAQRIAVDLESALADRGTALRDAERAAQSERRRRAEAARDRDHARFERARADRAARAASAGQALSRRYLARMLVAAGARALEDSDTMGAMLWFTEALRTDRGRPEREEAHRLRIGAALARCPRLVARWPNVAAGDISADGRTGVVATRNGAAVVWDGLTGAATGVRTCHGPDLRRALVGADGTRIATVGVSRVLLWDARTGRRVATLSHPRRVTDCEWGAHGRIATACEDGAVRVWDEAGRPVIAPRWCRATPVAVRLSPDGARVAAAGQRDLLGVWSLEAGTLLWSISAELGMIADLRFSPDGRRLGVALPKALISENEGVLTFRADTGEPIRGWLKHPEPASGLQFDASADHVLALNSNGTAVRYRAATYQPDRPAIKLGSPGTRAVYCDGNRTLVTVSVDTGVRIWDAATRRPLCARLADGVGGAEAAVSHDGRRLLVVDRSGTARLWDLTARTIRDRPHAVDVAAAAVVSRTGLLVTGDDAGRVRFWDATRGGEPTPVRGHVGRVEDIACASDGQAAATAGRDGRVVLWDLGSRRPAGVLRHPGPAVSVAFALDGRYLAACAGGEAYVWDVRSQRCVRVLGRGRDARAVALTPRGDLAATCAADGEVTVSEVASGRALYRTGHRGGVTSVSFSGDGTRLLTAGRDGVARVLDARSGEPRTPPLVHSDAVEHACFSADGRLVATAEGRRGAQTPRGARVWDTRTGRPVTPLLRHRLPVLHVAFSGDGKYVVSGSADGTVRAWEVGTGELVTPGLPMPGEVWFTHISAGGRRVVACDNTGALGMWRLDPPRGDPDSLQRLAEDLAGRSVDVTGSLTPLGAARHRASVPTEGRAARVAAMLGRGR